MKRRPASDARLLAVAFLVWSGLSSSAFSGACGSEPPPPREPAPATAPPHAAAAAPVEEREPTAEELPIPEDFASEAEQAIDAKSYRAELGALEKELTAEPVPLAP